MHPPLAMRLVASPRAIIPLPRVNKHHLALNLLTVQPRARIGSLSSSIRSSPVTTHSALVKIALVEIAVLLPHLTSAVTNIGLVFALVSLSISKFVGAISVELVLQKVTTIGITRRHPQLTATLTGIMNPLPNVDRLLDVCRTRLSSSTVSSRRCARCRFVRPFAVLHVIRKLSGISVTCRREDACPVLLAVEKLARVCGAVSGRQDPTAVHHAAFHIPRVLLVTNDGNMLVAAVWKVFQCPFSL